MRATETAMPAATHADAAPTRVEGDDPVAARRRQAAVRALEEAAARRREAAAAQASPAPVERSGRGGLDPARYGDWEVKGIATDF